jgi:molybdenum cofactor cytidylyltransferase
MSESAYKSSAIILLAAGNSSRMGSPKQLLNFNGVPLLRHAAETALRTGCGHVVVVLGAHAQRLYKVLWGLDVQIVLNPRWSDGMGTSIHAGLEAIKNANVTGAILALADQPFVTSEYLQSLIVKHDATGAEVVASQYSGTAGVPAFFSQTAFASLLGLQANQGCKGIVTGTDHTVTFIDCPEAAMDVDTPEDYARVIAGHRMGSSA